MSDSSLVAMAADVVRRTRRRLPPSVRTLAEVLPVSYEDYPGEDVLEDDLDPDLLGLFVGSAHGEETHQDNPLPPQIILYVENIWDYAEGDTAAFRREVRITYLHELGHYLGWDEDEVAARGLD